MSEPFYIESEKFDILANAGGMAEWSNAHAWKACRRVTASRVRISLLPFAVYPNSVERKSPDKILWIMPGLLPLELVLRGWSARRLCHQMPDMDGNQAIFRKNRTLTRFLAIRGRFSEAEKPGKTGGNCESIRIFAGNATNFKVP